MEITTILGARARRLVSRSLAAVALTLLTLAAGAAPVVVDWDALTWLPEGSTNLSETYTLAGFDVVVTYSGNTAFLDQTTTPPSPGITDPNNPANQNTGGLIPVESSLVVGTDYLLGALPADAQVIVTVDLSDYPNGVSDLTFTLFDIDLALGFDDQVTVTALAGGVSVDPTTIVTGPDNQQVGTNTVTATGGAPLDSADANASFTFAQTGISEVTIIYRNVATNPNPGFQWINLHDITFNFVQADMSLTKTVDNATPAVGTNVVYTVTLTNDGPDTATGLEVTDQLPAGLTYVSDDSGGSYNSVTGVWTAGSLASGASAVLQITALVNAAGPYDNVAELTAANEFDPDSTPGNNDPTEDDQDNVPIAPMPVADLSLTKVVNDAEPLPGANVIFDVVVSNAGPSDATGITVTDLLPSGLAYVADASTQGPYDPATGVWDVGALTVGSSATLTLTAQVQISGDFANTAEVATSDQLDPDSTPGNNDPTEDDQASAAVSPVIIGVAKSVSSGPVNNGDGTSTVAYDIDVRNFGATDLLNLRVVDDLSVTFAAATAFVVDSVSSPTLTVNPNYDGAADSNLLAGSDTLVIGDNGVITLVVTVTPGGNFGPYDNTAVGNAISPAGTPATDLSHLGVNPDPDSDGDPTNNNDPTPVSFNETPEIGIAKRVSTAPVNNGDGTFTFGYSMFVQNTGDVDLSAVQVVDNLSQTFAAAQAFQVDAISSADLTVNTNFNGNADINMLTGADTLALGASGEVQLTLTVTPGANPGPYQNTAVASGISPANTPVSDTSTDGVDPDPDGDGDPGNNSDPTPVVFVENPLLGLAKRVSAGPVNNGDGTFTASYEIFVENAGDVILDTLQVTDALGTTFAGAVSYTVDSVTSNDFALNPAFDGAGDTNLLLGTDTLGIGASGTLTIAFTVEPGANLGPYQNLAVGSAASPAGTPVQDESTDGVDPDPDNDGTPTNNNTPTPLTLVENPTIGAAKAVTSPPNDNNNGSFTFSYTIVIDNVGDVQLYDVQVVDDLSATFAQAGGFVVNAVQSNDLAVNPAYDGATDTNLLLGTDTLVLAAQAQLEVTLTVTPGAFSGPYLNTATSQGNSPAGTPVEDDSTDGLDPDPDNDGTPTNNNTPTPVTFTPPLIIVTKTANPRQVSIGDLVRYVVTAENAGGGLFLNLVLSDQIPAGFSYVDGSAQLVGGGGPLSVTGERPLQFGGIDLASGEAATLTYILRVGAGVVPGPAPNTVSPMRNGIPVGEPVTETIEVITDPDLQQTTIIGKVFLDWDADGWQDSANATGLRISGGPFGDGKALADIAGRRSVGDGLDRHQIVFTVPYSDAPLTITSAEGSRCTLTTSGEIQRDDSGDVARGRNAQDLLIVRERLSGARQAPRTIKSMRVVTHDAHIEPVRFESGKAVIPTQHVTRLREILAGLADKKNVRLSFIGHTDDQRLSKRTAAIYRDNQGLSESRAETVAALMQKALGLSADALQTDGRGYTQPLASNETLDGMALNRRVEIQVLYDEEVIEEIVESPDAERTGEMIVRIVNRGIGEEGIPGVRIATVEGLLVETDAHGRYHLEGIEGGFMERGRNFIMKVDPATLPDGVVFTTENPRVKRITQGLMNRFDFGVKLPGTPSERLYPINVKIAEVFFEENSDEIRPEFENAFAELGQRLRLHCGGKLFIEGNGDPRCGADEPDRLSTDIESETFIFVPHFGIRKSELTQEDRVQLEGLVERWRDAQDVSLVSIGHTSSLRIAPEHRDEYADNYALGQARAQTVADYLMQVIGIAPEFITIESRGPDEPVGDNSTREGRSANRRVELTLKGRRVIKRSEPAASYDCDPDLAERRARRVYDKIEEFMGKDVVCKVDVLVGDPPTN